MNTNRIVRLLFIFLFSNISLFSQEKDTLYNLNFEKVSHQSNLPSGWFMWGMKNSYSMTIDSTKKNSGKYSLLVQPTAGKGDKNSFGCPARLIPAIYEGQEIELRAYFKLENVNTGHIGLLLRIDGEHGSVGFENMEEKNIHGTKDWTMYSVKLPLSKEAKRIYIGALLTGDGKLWVDNFQVLIDGQDISKAKIRTLISLPADKDHQFDSISGINHIPLSTSKIEDLIVLGRTWGFLKYYHPVIAKGNYNWDYELFRILPKIIDSKTATERNEILVKWVEQIGVPTELKNEKVKASDIKLRPDLDWINDTITLGSHLSKTLNIIKEAKRTGENYYVSQAAEVGNPQFSNEKDYDYLKFPDTGFRLLALYRYWNMIDYYYPNRHLIGIKWDSTLIAFIPRFINDTNNLEYHLTALSLIGCIHDTHANIYSDPIINNYKGMFIAPVSVSFIENKEVVTNLYSKKDTSRSGLRKGDIITEVNHKKIEDILKERLPYTPASNYPTQLRNFSEALFRTNDSNLSITYSHNNNLETENIKTIGLLSYYDLSKNNDTCFKYINPNIAYIYPGTLTSDSDIDKMMPKLLETKGLIVDLRCYPSHFIVFSLNNFLLPKPTDFVKFSFGDIKTPGFFTFSAPLKAGYRNNKYYTGKVVILVNEQTQSQAEYTALALRAAPKVTVIGSTTAGADGNVSDIALPGGIHSYISGIGILYPDGRETQRVGIVPDIVVTPTIKGIQDGEDEMLEKAIEIINQQ